MQGPQTFHHLSKTIHDRMNPAGQVDIPTTCGGLCDGGSRTCVGTTDVSPPVKNNTYSEPAGQVEIPTRVEVCVIWHPRHF